MHLFTYGTLMFPEIWRRVVGRDFRTLPAVLVGYAVYRVQGGAYPVMTQAAAADSQVNGLIYLDVDDEAIAILDEYESTLYDRVSIDAIASDGRRIKCHAYVLPASRQAYASAESWDATRFEQEALGDYLSRLRDD